jgi:hypothetical protein
MSYKYIFAAAAALDVEIEQMDVKTAFLYVYIEEETWIAQPEGFDDKSGRRFRLEKVLHGLRQSPRTWYKKFAIRLPLLSRIHTTACRRSCLPPRQRHHSRLRRRPTPRWTIGFRYRRHQEGSV